MFSLRVSLFFMLLRVTLLIMTYVRVLFQLRLPSALVNSFPKRLTLNTLNGRILKFPYVFGARTNKPHIIPCTYASNRTTGGNAHENWNLLRLLPLIIGGLIPEAEPCLVFLDLKEIVELAVASLLNKETIAYLDCKITEHRDRFL